MWAVSSIQDLVARGAFYTCCDIGGVILWGVIQADVGSEQHPGPGGERCVLYML